MFMKKLTLLFVGLIGLTTIQAQSVNDVVNTVRERITLTGYAQGGYNWDSSAEPENEFRLARIILMGNAQITDRINAYAMYELCKSSLHELWFNYKWDDALQVKVGQMKTPFSIENPLSPTSLELVAPMAMVTDYMVCGSSPVMMPGSAGRDLGINVYGKLLDGKLSYDLALMNGVGRNKGDDNSQKDFVARLGVNPIKELTLGASLIKGTGNMDVVPDGLGGWTNLAAPIGGLKHNGNFRRDRYAVGAMLKTAPVNFRSEYMWGREGKSDSEGLYATGTVNNLLLKHLDLVASFDWLDNYADQSRRYTTGLQYWFYPKCRVQVLYSRLNNDCRPDANRIEAQLQVAF